MLLSSSENVWPFLILRALTNTSSCVIGYTTTTVLGHPVLVGDGQIVNGLGQAGGGGVRAGGRAGISRCLIILF